MDATVVVGAQGRIVLPAAVRNQLRLSQGDRLAVQVNGRRLILLRPSDAIQELQELGDQVPIGRSLAAELLAERRAEAAAE